MARVLIVHMSRGGTTERMAEFIAEGVRISGHEAYVKKSEEIEGKADLEGFEAYVFGCTTDHLDMPSAFREFLTLAEKAGLAGKVGGAFSSRSHPSSGGGTAAGSVFKVMESELKMRMSNLGPFSLEGRSSFNPEEDTVDGPEGMRACQEYGKAIGAML